MKIGYHASHEQFSPGRLLGLVKQAEKSGFNACLSSDHFHPWSNNQGQSGFAWAWLGAAMEATSIPFGVINAPGQRYHPAIIAQASATLSMMYSDRFWLCIGSGEQLNENITGQSWPEKINRNKRLQECAEVIRALWRGEVVTHHGLVDVVQAKLYSVPDTPPCLFGAALTTDTAGWLSEWADGMVTAAISVEQLLPLKKAFLAGKQGGTIFIKMDISYNPDEEKARQDAWEQWRVAILGNQLMPELKSPEEFEQAAKFIRPVDMDRNVAIVTEMSRLKILLDAFKEEGVSLVSVHNVGMNQEEFIKDFGKFMNGVGTACFE